MRADERRRNEPGRRVADRASRGFGMPAWIRVAVLVATLGLAIYSLLYVRQAGDRPRQQAVEASRVLEWRAELTAARLDAQAARAPGPDRRCKAAGADAGTAAGCGRGSKGPIARFRLRRAGRPRRDHGHRRRKPGRFRRFVGRSVRRPVRRWSGSPTAATGGDRPIDRRAPAPAGSQRRPGRAGHGRQRGVRRYDHRLIT